MYLFIGWFISRFVRFRMVRLWLVGGLVSRFLIFWLVCRFLIFWLVCRFLVFWLVFWFLVLWFVARLIFVINWLGVSSRTRAVNWHFRSDSHCNQSANNDSLN